MRIRTVERAALWYFVAFLAILVCVLFKRAWFGLVGVNDVAQLTLASVVDLSMMQSSKLNRQEDAK